MARTNRNPRQQANPRHNPIPRTPDDDAVLQEEANETVSLIDDIPELERKETDPRPAELPPTDEEHAETPPTPVAGDPEPAREPNDKPPVVESKPLPITGEESDEELQQKLTEMEPQWRSGSTPEHVRVLKKIIGQFKKERDDARGTIKAKDTEVAELKKKIVPDEELENLRASQRYMETRAVEQLPKWRAFDEEINKIDASASELLKRFDVKPALLDAIKKRGGIIKFSSSKTPAGKQWKNPDGSQMSEEQWFQQEVYSKLNDMQKAELATLTSSAYSKQREKNEAIDKAKVNASATIKEEATTRQKEIAERSEKHLTKLISSVLPDIGLPLQRPADPASDAKPEDRERILAEQKEWDEADKHYTNGLMPKSIEEGTENAFYSAFGRALIPRYKKIKEELAAEKARSKKAEDDLAAIKRSRSTGGLRNAPPPIPGKPITIHSDMNDEQAMDAGLPK